MGCKIFPFRASWGPPRPCSRHVALISVHLALVQLESIHQGESVCLTSGHNPSFCPYALTVHFLSSIAYGRLIKGSIYLNFILSTMKELFFKIRTSNLVLFSNNQVGNFPLKLLWERSISRKSY